MIKKKILDRRINRTRKSLQDALPGLILEKGFSNITVQDVLDRANVGRSTFYAHFQNIDDLLLSQFDDVRMQFEDCVEAEGIPAENPWKLTELIFQHAQNQRQLYKALIGERGGNIMLAHIDRYFSALIKEHLQLQLSDMEPERLPSEVLTHYIVSSLTSLLIWWLDNDTQYSAEQMNAMFLELTVHGVQSVIEQMDAKLA